MVRDILRLELDCVCGLKILEPSEKIPSVAVNSADPRVSLFTCIVVCFG